MKKAVWLLAFAVVLLAGQARAERPPQQRKEAALVVDGTVKKITTKQSAFFGDGVQTDYTAEVLVSKVESGKGAKAGDTVRVRWYDVTKRPSKLVPAAYGHAYAIKEKDAARFWLTDGKGKDWTIIYNRDGVEKLKKKD